MEVTLPADLGKQVQHELASGRYRSADDLVVQAVDQASR
jgi:Arc/MetJ-type ribon-helix-helix transcriptional regulator